MLVEVHELDTHSEIIKEVLDHLLLLSAKPHMVVEEVETGQEANKQDNLVVQVVVDLTQMMAASMEDHH